MLKAILTTADIEIEFGVPRKTLRSLFRDGIVPAKDISKGKQRPTYRVRRIDWDAYWAQPDNIKQQSPAPQPEARKPAGGRRQRIDSHVRKKTI